jgi:hypothetical protein
MFKKRIFIFSVITIFLILSACTPQPKETSTTEPGSISSATQSLEPTVVPSPSPTPTQTPLPTSDGPILLIQTDIDTYKIIDFALGEQYPFIPPVGTQQINLGGNLSPGKTRLIIRDASNKVKIMGFVSGYVQPVEITSTGFDPNQSAEAALAALPGMKLSIDGALAAVKSAFETSISKIRWYQDDEHLMIVTVGSSTSTQLTVKDLLTGEDDILETMPGLVENYWRNGDWVLLKKSYDFEPGIWQDDRYYLVNLDTRDVKTIALPDDIDNPRISWLGGQSLGIIHQAEPIGGVGYSILDIEIMETQQVVDGSFSSIQSYQGGLLLFRQDTENLTTTVQRLDLAGETQKKTVLPERCFFYLIYGERILSNCETESLILDPSLNAVSFGDPIFLLTQAPDGSIWVLVTRLEEVFLLDDAFENRTPLNLEGVPLEVRWIPDSSGFLYRILGKLFLYDLGNDSSRLVVESDLYSDYTNINAAWINLN